MTTAMTVYICIFAAGFVFLAISFLFSFEGELDHDVPSVDHGLDDHSASPSFFSAKVISCFLMGFGALASVSNNLFTQSMESGTKYVLEGLFGMVGGLIVGFIGWLIIKLFLSQQGHSNYSLEMFIGLKAQLSVSITEGGVGEIICDLRGQRRSLDVRSMDGKTIQAGTIVEVMQVSGNIGLVSQVIQ